MYFSGARFSNSDHRSRPGYELITFLIGGHLYPPRAVPTPRLFNLSSDHSSDICSDHCWCLSQAGIITTNPHHVLLGLTRSIHYSFIILPGTLFLLSFATCLWLGPTILHTVSPQSFIIRSNWFRALYPGFTLHNLLRRCEPCSG